MSIDGLSSSSTSTFSTAVSVASRLTGTPDSRKSPKQDATSEKQTNFLRSSSSSSMQMDTMSTANQSPCSVMEMVTSYEMSPNSSQSPAWLYERSSNSSQSPGGPYEMSPNSSQIPGGPYEMSPNSLQLPGCQYDMSATSSQPPINLLRQMCNCIPYNGSGSRSSDGTQSDSSPVFGKSSVFRRSSSSVGSDKMNLYTNKSTEVEETFRGFAPKVIDPFQLN
jgi:hypothetical protein